MKIKDTMTRTEIEALFKKILPDEKTRYEYNGWKIGYLRCRQQIIENAKKAGLNL